MRKFVLILISLSFFFSIYAQEQQQTVGLVMSGGGAKGIAHIGVIQALEENDIPIDYITGTSMGAIVGGLYASGYSPKEMLDLFRSEDFYECYTGDLRDVPMINLRKDNPSPDVIGLTLTMKGWKQVAVGVRGIALVDPAALNLKFFELFTPPSIAASNDFNRLFVPFRCVASDIYKKKEVLFSDGSLARAIQSSMSIPFYFRPVENEDNKILIDGGVYNNLPIQPMKKNFHPDFIIASNVTNSDKPKIINDDIGEFVINMVLQRNDSLPLDEEGIVVDVLMGEIGMMDFSRVNESYLMGYNEGIKMIDSIKQCVSRRKPFAELQSEREKYKEQLPEINIENIEITGATETQKEYFESFFWKNKEKPYTLNEFRNDYLNLSAGNPSLEISPVITTFEEKADEYSLGLNIKRNGSPRIYFGGNVSSMYANQLYIGLKLSRFRRFPIDYNLDMYWGNAFNSVAYMANIETGGFNPIRYQFMAAFNNFRFTDPKQVFFDYAKPLFNDNEYFVKLKMANLLFGRMKAETSLGMGFLQDKYSSLNPDLVLEDPNKAAHYAEGKAMFKLFKSNLDHKLYPTFGERYNLSASYFYGKGSWRIKNNESEEFEEVHNDNYNYYSVSLEAEKYFSFNNLFKLKGLINGFYSNKSVFYDYESTVIQAPAFTPTPHSLITFNPDLRANSYLAVGVTPILKINSSSHFRFENYLFMPIQPIKNNDGQAIYGDYFSRNTYFGEVSYVVNFPILSIQLFANYYSRAESKFNFGLNIGYLIFGEKWKN